MIISSIYYHLIFIRLTHSQRHSSGTCIWLSTLDVELGLSFDTHSQKRLLQIAKYHRYMMQCVIEKDAKLVHCGIHFASFAIPQCIKSVISDQWCSVICSKTFCTSFKHSLSVVNCTQQNSYSISHLLGTVTTQWLPLWRCSHCSLVPDTVTTEQWLHGTHTLLCIYYHGAYVEICLLGT